MPRRRRIPLDLDRLWNLRVRAGLSQQELAKRVGLSKQHVSNVEAGRVGVSPETLRRIADELGCEVVDLMPHAVA